MRCRRCSAPTTRRSTPPPAAGRVAVPAAGRPRRPAGAACARRPGLAAGRTGPPYRLGHRHCRHHSCTGRTAGCPGDRTDLFAAADRLQPPTGLAHADSGGERPHRGARQCRAVGGAAAAAHRCDPRTVPRPHRCGTGRAPRCRPPHPAGDDAQLHPCDERRAATVARRRAVPPDTRFAHALLQALRDEGDLVVGDNEPYSVSSTSDYAVPVHGEGRGLVHVELEIRRT